LMPKEKKFPICPACRSENCVCAPTCAGVTAAYVRSRQWKYPGVAKKAKSLQKKYCKK
jgi:hypothetical protein